MLVAFELKKSIEQVLEMDKEEIGWWLAFFKYKNELEEKAMERARKRRGRR